MTDRSVFSIDAHAFIISRQAMPTASNIAMVVEGLRGLPWTWIGAGIHRVRCDALPGQPPIHDAGAVGLLAGRQKALDLAGSADVIVYLDDDVSLPCGWAEAILAPFSDPEVHFVGCRYLPKYECKPPFWMEGLWTEAAGFRFLGQLSLLDGGEGTRAYAPTLVWGLCFAARRATLAKLGGFHPDGYPWPLRRYRGDGETGLSLKAEAAGLKAIYQGDTHVCHHVPRSRMTPRYFEQRAFLQGISDSYTELRSTGAVPTRISSHWREIARAMKGGLLRHQVLKSPTSKGISNLMARAHSQGRSYHLEQVRSDPGLLEWVMRKDYRNYNLPAGWEKYAELPEIE